ncbi:MAG: thioesterase [Chitinophagales bacterium]|nr:thioesterase [Chitinophagales bacterium]
MTNFKIQLLLLTQLPIAWIAGLKLFSYSEETCSISVKLGFLNKNPFKSMFWAVQGMAAELSTGLLCMDIIQKSNQNISMLVIEQKGQFFKKAKGKIIFTCTQGSAIKDTIQKAIDTKESQTIMLTSIGKDEACDKVSAFEFVWSFKVK